MDLQLYDNVVKLIGTLPANLEWIYGIGTLILLCAILGACLFPFIMIFKFWE